MSAENSMPTHLKDGTLWDDEKSDEWIDAFFAKLDEAEREGKVVHGGPSKDYLAQLRKYGQRSLPKHSISMKYLPQELRREFMQNA